MRSKMLITQAALAAVALLISSAAGAALSLIDCGDAAVPGAEANETAPVYCAIGTTPNDSPATETGVINDVFSTALGTAADPFFFVAKYEIEGCVECLPGFSLSASPASDPWDYMFQLLTDYDGQVVDFVLMVKQPGGPDDATNVAYAWTGLTLDVDGFYNSFRGDYSHISAFIRGVDVSEPAPLALLGLGLLGLGLMRRKLA